MPDASLTPRQALIARLDSIAARAPYATDPREASTATAAALADFHRAEEAAAAPAPAPAPAPADTTTTAGA